MKDSPQFKCGFENIGNIREWKRYQDSRDVCCGWVVKGFGTCVYPCTVSMCVGGCWVHAWMCWDWEAGWKRLLKIGSKNKYPNYIVVNSLLPSCEIKFDSISHTTLQKNNGMLLKGTHRHMSTFMVFNSESFLGHIVISYLLFLTRFF